MKIRGAKAHSARLKRMVSPQARARVGKAVYAASDYLRVEAQHSITEGSISGAGHVPSAPGEPPNADTRQLDTNIVNAKTGELTAEVSSNAPYSAALEFGTSKMEARPFMKPAAKKTRPRATELVVRAVKQSTRKKG